MDSMLLWTPLEVHANLLTARPAQLWSQLAVVGCHAALFCNTWRWWTFELV